MAGTPWTQEEINILKEMAEAGKTIKEIKSVLLNRSDDSINSKASTLGLSLAGPKPEIDFAKYREIMKAEMEVKCL